MRSAPTRARSSWPPGAPTDLTGKKCGGREKAERKPDINVRKFRIHCRLRQELSGSRGNARTHKAKFRMNSGRFLRSLCHAFCERSTSIDVDNCDLIMILAFTLCVLRFRIAYVYLVMPYLAET